MLVEIGLGLLKRMRLLMTWTQSPEKKRRMTAKEKVIRRKGKY